MTKKIDIMVYDNGLFKREANERFIRQCPNGSFGVVFRNKVFPIYDDNRIYFRREIRKKDCDILVQVRAKQKQTKDFQKIINQNI